MHKDRHWIEYSIRFCFHSLFIICLSDLEFNHHCQQLAAHLHAIIYTMFLSNIRICWYYFLSASNPHDIFIFFSFFIFILYDAVYKNISNSFNMNIFFAELKKYLNITARRKWKINILKLTNLSFYINHLINISICKSFLLETNNRLFFHFGNKFDGY